jgi:hypothetical protein
MTFKYEKPGKVNITMEGFIRDSLNTSKDIIGASSFPGYEITDEVNNPLLPDTIKYIRGTLNLLLIQVNSCIDASYSVHMDKKSHTGCVITLGKGAIYPRAKPRS